MSSAPPPAASINSISEKPSVNNLFQIAESITINQPTTNNIRGKGEEIFSLPDVQVYFIQPLQNVATKFSATTLNVITIPPEDQDLVSEIPKPPAFLEAGEWLYPLIPNTSPVYRTIEKYYLFPDLLSGVSGASVGLVFSSNISEKQRDTFESILLNLAGLESFPTSPIEFGNTDSLISSAERLQRSTRPTTFQQSSDISTPDDLANKIADGFMAVAEVASEYFDKGAGFVKSRLSPATEPVVIDPRIQQTVRTVKKFTGKVVELSSFAVSKLGETSAKLAAFAAYYFQSTASSVIVNYGGQSEHDTAKFFDALFEVTEETVNSIGTIYGGLHHAGRILATSLANNTVSVVEHCYGAQAGQIVEGAAETVGNLATIGLKANNANPSKVIARAVKDTGRAMLCKAPEPHPQQNYNPF